MEAQNKLTLEKCNVHNFRMKVKAVVCSGSCQILKEQSRFNLQSKTTSLVIPFDIGLIRLTQINYLTYLLIKDETVFSISIYNTQQEQISKFQAFIEKYSKIINFYQLSPDQDRRNIIATNCPLGPSSQPLGANNSDNLQHAGKAVGNVFGTVSAIFQFDQFNRDARNTVSRFQENNLGSGEGSSWGRFKMKCSGLNKKMAEGLKPVSDACKKTSSDIGEKFKGTNNSVIKGIREWSKKTESALNSGYKQGEQVEKNRVSVPQQNKMGPS